MTLAVAGIVVLSGCDDNSASKPAPAVQDQSIDRKTVDEWVGQWNGPEGTYMKISKTGEGYRVTIKDLDKESEYLGVLDGKRIRFLRDDHQEFIHYGAGRDTGMKWLMEEPNCLIVKEGEGYCRKP
ncbi:MAG: hypothetical protein DI551_04015 [Micavibrio aeruginosavorus]|uniref:Lipoprotein n=1 Tax=Micavibrio aeruginosavorus TaxID=349221 RepID=A0A2W5N0J4_9BACT|nr:MAG: hypothetical protein DI551_04015 [Micavibrio aeruginosavorus]